MQLVVKLSPYTERLLRKIADEQSTSHRAVVEAAIRTLSSFAKFDQGEFIDPYRNHVGHVDFG